MFDTSVTEIRRSRAVLNLIACATAFALSGFAKDAWAESANFRIFQQPSLSRSHIAFNYADHLWIVDRRGGQASRLRTGMGIESKPIFSPDGGTIAFTRRYGGTNDVYTISPTGGVPHRITYHPAGSTAVGWAPDGKEILFRSSRESFSGYSPKLYTVSAEGGHAARLPLPAGYEGQLSPDGAHVAYVPFVPASDFRFTSFDAWQNYHGGRSGIISITAIRGLESVQIPHENAPDFSPVYVGSKIYFLSARSGRVGIFSHDPTTQAVVEVLHNTGPDLRSLSGGPDGVLVYDQLGKIFLFDTATNQSRLVPIDVNDDVPEALPHLENVSAHIGNIALSPAGQHVAIEAHGEILTARAKDGSIRNLTNTPGIAERDPAWSPDGQSIAFFSDESGLYALHIASHDETGKVRKYRLSSDPTYYYTPIWSPDSKHITFYDNRLNRWIVNVATGKTTIVDKKDYFGWLTIQVHDAAWSPDSKWLAYTSPAVNHFNVLNLFSMDSGKSTQITSQMADVRSPTFDRNGKYLYFAASTNAGGHISPADMSPNLYSMNNNIYAAVLANDQFSPVDSQSDSEGSKPGAVRQSTPIRIDLPGIESRIVSLPLPDHWYFSLRAGGPGTLYFLEYPEKHAHSDPRWPLDLQAGASLSRFTLVKHASERFADHVKDFDLSFDGEKVFLEWAGVDQAKRYSIVPSGSPAKTGDGALSLADLNIRVEPRAEWLQMYHEVWRIQRAFLYAPNFHGLDTVAAERRFEPYVSAVVSRSGLNYIFHEMLGAISLSHMEGGDANIPGPKEAGGLLGADYSIQNNRYCIAKIYDGGEWNPTLKSPLAQPGLNVKPGDCILAINGQSLIASSDIQALLVGTADHPIVLRIGGEGTNIHDIRVVPISSEADLRMTDWIESNRRTVDRLSNNRLAYVYVPNTASDGFSYFNRYYLAQTDKQGVIIDVRYNDGGFLPDYLIEVMQRHQMAYLYPRYGALELDPSEAIFGPKVMILNEVTASSGDVFAWAFRNQKLGTLVGRRSWGGCVVMGGGYPRLMDGGWVSSPTGGCLSPQGEWAIENKGVEPDVVVDQDPKFVNDGHDPQLEKAIEIAIKALSDHPAPPIQIKLPPFPDYYKQQTSGQATGK